MLHYDTMYCQGIIISVITIHLTDALQLRELRLPLNLYIGRFREIEVVGCRWRGRCYITLSC